MVKSPDPEQARREFGKTTAAITGWRCYIVYISVPSPMRCAASVRMIMFPGNCNGTVPLLSYAGLTHWRNAFGLITIIISKKVIL
jgi:hypothetical protein